MNMYEISRRRFLQVAGATMAGAALAGCTSGEEAVQPTRAADVPTPSATFTDADAQALRRPEDPDVEPLRARSRSVV